MDENARASPFLQHFLACFHEKSYGRKDSKKRVSVLSAPFFLHTHTALRPSPQTLVLFYDQPAAPRAAGDA